MCVSLLLALALAGANPIAPAAARADQMAIVEGTTKATAIKVDSVPEEYAILQQRHLRLKVQALVFGDDHHPYDALTATAEDGSEVTIWFDIKSFFGKEFGF